LCPWRVTYKDANCAHYGLYLERDADIQLIVLNRAK
jgi:hypothetical protein